MTSRTKTCRQVKVQPFRTNLGLLVSEGARVHVIGELRALRDDSENLFSANLIFLAIRDETNTPLTILMMTTMDSFKDIQFTRSKLAHITLLLNRNSSAPRILKIKNPKCSRPKHKKLKKKRKGEIDGEKDETFMPQAMMDFLTGMSLADEVERAKNDITEKLDSSLEKHIDTINKYATKLVMRMEDALYDSSEGISSTISAVAMATAVSVFAVMAIYKGGPLLLKAVKFALNLMGKIGMSVVTILLDSIYDRRDELQPQAGKLGGSDLLANLVSLILGFATMENFNSAKALKFMMDYKKRSNIRDSVEDLGHVFKNAVAKLKAYMYGNKVEYELGISDNQFADWYSATEAFVCKIEELRSLRVDDTMIYTTSRFELLQMLLTKARLYKRRYPRRGEEMERVNYAIGIYYKDLEKIEQEFSKRAFQKNSLRIKPLTILLKGKSGVGKSAMTVPLIDEVMMRTMKSKEELELYRSNNMDFIYSRASETDYWDGYYGQKAVVYDDFLQADENKVNSSILNEAFELIRASNIYPFLLHKAHLEDKGNSYLASRVILCSTNNFNMHCQTIREPEALTRRFDIVAEVYPTLDSCRPDLKEGGLSQRRLGKVEGGYSSDVYEIHVEIPGRPEKEIMNYQTFVRFCISMYNKVELLGTSYLEKIAEIREKVYDDITTNIDSKKADALFEIETGKITAKFKDKLYGEKNLRYSESSDDDDTDDSCETVLEAQSGQLAYTESLPSEVDISEINLDAEFAEQEAKAIAEEAPLRMIKTRYALLRNRVLDSVGIIKRRIYEYFNTKTWKLLGVATVAVAVGVGAFAMWRGFGGFSEQSYKPTRYKSKQNPKTLAGSIVNLTPQNGDDRITTGFVSILSHNMYVFVIDGKQVSSCIFVKDTWCMMNKHVRLLVRDSCKENSIVELRPMSNTVQQKDLAARTFSRDQFLSFEVKTHESEPDLILVRFKKVRNHRDIRSKFMTAEEVKDYDKHFDAVLYRVSTKHSKVYSSVVDCGFHTKKHEFFGNLPVIAYPVATESGDCGSLLFSLNKHSGYGKILSFHVGLDNGHGIGVTIPEKFMDLDEPLEAQSGLSEDLIEEHKIMDKVNMYVQPHTSSGLLTSAMGSKTLEINKGVIDGTVSENGGLVYRGKVEKAPFVARKTKLRESLLNGWCFPPKKKPALLVKKDGIDPFDLCLDRYDTPDTKVNTRYLAASALVYSELLLGLPVTTGVGKRILTFEESIAGIPREKYINGIPRKTSAGFPLCMEHSNGKKEIFGSEGDYDFTSETAKSLKKQVEDFERDPFSKRLSFIYLDAMKDELRPIEKVEKKSTRMISCSPLLLSSLTRKYFSAFSSFVMHNRIYNGCAVGINPFSEDWTRLASFLGGGSACNVAGDFSRFDSTQCTGILWAILDIINDWYNDKHSEIRKILWKELVNSVHLHGNELHEFTHCLPSGHIMTSIVNSMYVNLSFMMCWCDMFGTANAIESFFDHVRVVAYGDDHVVALSSFAINNGFDFMGITEFMNNIGLIYTTEDKSEEIYSYKDLEDCTFLKRAFVRDENRWLAPLDLDTVLEMPMWYRDGPDPLQRQNDNVDNAINELSMHSSETFETWGNALMQAVALHNDELRRNTLLLDQEYYRLRCYHNWVCEEFLEPEEFVAFEEPIVPHTSEIEERFSILTIDPRLTRWTTRESEESDFEPQSLDGVWVKPFRKQIPANINDKVRQDFTSQSSSSVTDTQYTAINDTNIKGMNTHAATGFLEDATERVYEPFPIEQYDPKKLNTGLVNLDRSDVIRMLETPVRIRSINVLSTSTANTTIDDWTLPFDSSNFSSSGGIGQDMWLSRLNAFQGFRGDAVLEFKVNCQRFAQGRLLVQYIPGQSNAIGRKSRRFNLMTKSQCPNVQINLNRDTSVVMRLPYVSAWPAYDLTRTSPTGNSVTLETSAGVMGDVFVNVYSPLVGASSVDIEVYLHFENVELYNVAFSPQANTEDKEAPKADGILSKPLTVVADAARVLTKIPSLKSYAGTAEWFTRLMANAASSYGFSKPFNESANVRVNMIQHPYAANSDGDSACVKLGISHTAKLDVLPSFAGNDLDEMSLEYICNRAAYFATFDYNTSQNAGDELWWTTVAPYDLDTTTTIFDLEVKTFVPFSYMASFFRLWRADLVYTFKVVKTEFHTGRIQVKFNPGLASSGVFSTSAYSARVILDMKESDTFVVKVPYMALTPMLTNNLSTGFIRVNVITPLMAPPTVSSSVSVIVEVSAENVCFAQPLPTNNHPVNGTNSAFTPQSGELGDEEVAPREKVLVMPGLESNDRLYDHTRFTCSEAVTSIKQLLTRFVYLSDDYAGATANTTAVISPFGIGATYETGGVYTSTGLKGDYLTALAPLFALRRGSVKLWFTNRASSDSIVAMGDSVESNRTNVLFSGSQRPVNNYIPLHKPVSGFADMVQVPQYSRTHSMGCEAQYTSPRSLDIGEPTTLIYYRTATAWTAGTLTFARSVGDDFQLGYFLGVPLMHVGTGLTINF